MTKIKGQIYVPNKDNPLSEDDYDLILPQTTVEQVEGLPEKLLSKADLIDNKVPAAQLPEMDYVPTGDVANAANKIPRYNAAGHLVLPDGSEFWIG